MHRTKRSAIMRSMDGGSAMQIRGKKDEKKVKKGRREHLVLVKTVEEGELETRKKSSKMQSKLSLKKQCHGAANFSKSLEVNPSLTSFYPPFFGLSNVSKSEQQ